MLVVHHHAHKHAHAHIGNSKRLTDRYSLAFRDGWSVGNDIAPGPEVGGDLTTHPETLKAKIPYRDDQLSQRCEWEVED